MNVLASPFFEDGMLLLLCCEVFLDPFLYDMGLFHHWAMMETVRKAPLVLVQTMNSSRMTILAILIQFGVGSRGR